MGDLKPIGSEKLPLDDKIKRIMEIARYGEKPKQGITDQTKTTHYKKECKDGIYAVVKEKDGYYVKQGINENTLDYIGGMMKKNKNRFNSYAEAVKRCELLTIPLTEQDKRFVLKSNKPSVDEDPKSAPVASDDTVAPPSDVAPSADASAAPAANDTVPPPSDDASSAPAPEASMGDEGGEDTGGSDDEISNDDVSDDGMDSDHTGGFHMKKIQKLTGKLGQVLRQNKEDMEDDDIKYVINSILSAVDISKLSDESKDEITSKFEDDADYSDEDIDNVDGDDFENGSESDDMNDMGSDGDTGSGDEMQEPAHGEEDDEKELGEVDDIFENFSRLEKILKEK